MVARVRLHRKPHRLATYNIQTVADGATGLFQLVQLSYELTQAHINVCGLQEVRKRGNGIVQLPEAKGGCWHLIWSGVKEGDPRQYGVALAISHMWKAALCNWSAVNDRLLVARFAASIGQHVSIVVAYAPTEASDPDTKNEFYELLLSTLVTIPTSDKVAVLGDFNASIGPDWSNCSGVLGKHILFHKSLQTSDNGQKLLNLAASLKLRIANSWFQHNPEHLWTWRHPRTNSCSVKDFILISSNGMSGVRDCRVFPNLHFQGSDHRPVVATWQLRLRASPPSSNTESGKKLHWDTTKLQHGVIRESFALKLSNRFEALAAICEDGDTDRAHKVFAQDFHEVAGEVLGPLPSGPRKLKPGLSEETLNLIVGKKKAYNTWRVTPSAANKEEYKLFKSKVKRAVREDERAYYKSMADRAESLRASGNTHLWAKHARRLGLGLGAETKSCFPKYGLLSPGGELSVDPQQIAKEFEHHFANVFRDNGANVDEAALESLVSEVERLPQTEDDSSMAEAPSLDEVTEAVHTLRNLAAPGEDSLSAPLLKSCEIAIKYLHRLIVSVWKTEQAPLAWKRALIVPLYKGIGDPQLPDNYRGISLLSIPGKAYATIILRRIRIELEKKLHEAQCGFRAGKGTTDAMFVLRCMTSSALHKNTPLHLAFIDLTKAFDSVNRVALFKVLRLYGVHPKLVTLMEDLHSGTDALIKLADKRSNDVHVQSGVRQGCVLAPSIFNVFMDFVVRKTLGSLPPDCEARWIWRSSSLGAEMSSEVVITDMSLPLLMYADDLTLMSNSPDGLKEMLLTMDAMAIKYGLRINASKTKVMTVGKDLSNDGVHPLEGICLSGGPVQVVSEFKYLGGILRSDGSMDAEISARQKKALHAFKQMEGVWRNPHLAIDHKMLVYKTFIIPHFLYGAETWNSTLKQEKALERVHSSCLRTILGVTKLDRHSIQHVRKACKIKSLEAMITAARLRWLGHVSRMDDGRYPKAVLFGEMHGQAVRGRPYTRVSDVAKRAIQAAKMSWQNWRNIAQFRLDWRGKILAYLKQDRSVERWKPRPPTRKQPFRQCKFI